MAAFEQLAASGRLPVRVYAMLSDATPLLERWLEKGARRRPSSRC